jgi:hypothetical protein
MRLRSVVRCALASGRSGALLVSLVAGMSAGSAALAADAFSLTGTYEGFFVCDNVADGVSGGFGRPMTMEVLQTGDRIDMQNTVALEASGPPSQTRFRGRLAAAASGGGVVAGYAEVCDATFPHKEMVRIFPVSPARQPFSFAADTVFVADSVPGMSGLVVESCKWSLTRVSTDTPRFKACP